MTGRQMETLRDALCAAFDQNSFDQMLRLRLDKDREQLAGAGDLRSIIFRVITTAVQEGWEADLVRAAVEYNPGSPDLRRFCQENADLASREKDCVPPAAAVAEARPQRPEDPEVTGILRVVFDPPNAAALMQWQEMTVTITQNGVQSTTVAEVKPSEPLQLRPGEYRLRVTGEGYKTEQPFTIREGANPDFHVQLVSFRSFRSGWLAPVRGVAYSPDGRHFAAAQWVGGEVWDAQSGKRLFTLDTINFPTWDVTFSPDSTRLASTSPYLVQLWDVQSGQRIRELNGAASDNSYQVAFSPNGKCLAGASRERGFVRVWDVDSSRELLSLEASDVMPKYVFYSSDGKHLIVAAEWVTVHEARTGKKLYPIREIKGFGSLALSPDGQRLATTGFYDGSLRLWDWQTRKEVLAFAGHTSGQPIDGVAFSRDGKRLASASRDNTVKLWDAQTGQEILTIDGQVERRKKQTGPFYSVAFSHDGNSLLTGSEGEENLRLWVLPE